tara:strand:- start:2283 stop:3380 length:1098 start_codon:yes stop_codon:yes gene_type:complete
MTSDQSAIEKRCIICGTSCAGQPRIKDATGKYAHKACAKQQAKVQPTIQPLDLSPEEEPEMAAFLDDLPSPSDQQPTSGIRAACPGCGSSINSDAMICVNCGCNTKTGRGIKTAKVKTKSKSNGPNLAAKAGSLAAAPFLPIIGAVIGGAIGAAAWAAVAHFTGYEIGFLATGVGAICGIGAVIGAGGDGNAWSGTVAVVVAIVSIITGKTIVNSIYVDQLQSIKIAVEEGMESKHTLDDFTESDAIFEIASDIAWELEEDGQTIDWPNPEIDLYEALDLSDFPQSIVDQTNKKWNSMDDEERIEYRQTQIEEFNQASLAFNDFLDDEMEASSDLMSNLSLFDALWAFLALGAAWQFGNGGFSEE